MGSAQGSKWVVILLIYFAVLTTIVGIITFVGGGFLDSDLGVLKPDTCNNPRYIYEPYNSEPIYHTSMSEQELSLIGINVISTRASGQTSHLDCMKSKGILSEDVCNTINGCEWASIGVSWWSRLLSWTRLYDSTEPEPTCLGTINSDFYNIESRTIFLSGGTDVVLPHENDAFPYNQGSICLHPEVINSQEMCDLFSCTWLTPQLIQELDIESLEIKAGLGFFRTTWNAISEMFTFRFNWGFENYNLINYMLNFFTFWLPLIILMFAIIQIIRG